MRKLKRAAAGLLAAAGITAVVVVDHEATASTVDTQWTDQSVTLLTGDRVTLTGDAFGVEPGPGREGMTFQTRRVRGRLTVIPADAAPLLTAGRLDPRLFDVTTLLSYGYDDRRADLPLIVTMGDSRATVPTSGATVDRRLPRLGAVAMRQDRRERGEFWRGLAGAAPQRVWLDGMREPSLDESVPQIGAPAAWTAGHTGEGVTVAVLDTGVDDTHPDLAGKVTGRANFTEGAEDDQDHVGHGTHVAATIAGNGSPYRGVAPGSTLLDGKVCVDGGCAESWILAGMEWAAAERGAEVVNMSLGGFDFPGVDPLEEAVNTLSERYGTLFVVAAGNEGPFEGTVGSPASADAALAVGAVDGADQVADFSSRGPRVGDGAIKPDITAPGVAITAAQAGGGHVAMSGTSMATPHVAGAAAILAQQHPDWPGGRLKSALMASASPTPGVGVFAQGAGRVDVAKAITQAVTAEPASVDFGAQSWPHTDDEPVTREVTYRNADTEAVTLDLGVDAPTFTVRPASVTLPAGGAATVTVTADTRVPGPDGPVTGTLTGGVLLSVHKEVESYDVTIDRIDRDGNPPEFSPVELYRLDSSGSYFLNEERTVRLPKGRYNLSALFFGRQEGPMTLMVQPVLEVSSAFTMTVDARLAKASTITVPDGSAALEYVHIGYTIPLGGEPVTLGQLGRAFDRLYTGQIGTASSELTSNISAQWRGGTDVYQISHHEPGRLISGYQRTVTRAELAVLRMRTSGGDHEAVQGGMFAISRTPGQPGQSLISPVFASLPSVSTWYVNTDGGVEWRAGLYQSWEDPATGDQYLYAPTWGPWTRYQARRTYEQVWNQAVIAPVLPGPDGPRTGVTRAGDRITVAFSPYGDGAGRLGAEREGGTTTLFRDGVQIGQSDVAGAGEFTVPAGTSEYRLEIHATRGAPYELSTKIDTAWTFRSWHGDAVLPLWTVRFSPRLDERNTAPAGRSFTVPVVATPAPGAETGRLKDLTVEVSYDDGATWAVAPVVKGTAVVRHPRGPGFVSLRAKASDTAGNTVTQTVIHAYSLEGAGR
jgi:subtilisin family serine protease